MFLAMSMITGKLPWTGNETVLDALQFAGGLLRSAEPKDIRLVRPGAWRQARKVYKVDLDAPSRIKATSRRTTRFSPTTD